jgi:hypothetical protein
MKTIYVCGDSFGCSDPDFDSHWADLLAQYLGRDWRMINCCKVGASNLQIATQVEQAMINADFIIYLATTSTRVDVKISDGSPGFVDMLDPASSGSYLSYMTTRIDENVHLDAEQRRLVKQYITEFFDLGLAIKLNEFLIEGVLSRLQNWGHHWLFDQGGFEHPSHGGKQSYFSAYASNRSQYCLWDYAPTPLSFRPYYHVTDRGVHETIARYYLKHIQNHAS